MASSNASSFYASGVFPQFPAYTMVPVQHPAEFARQLGMLPPTCNVVVSALENFVEQGASLVELDSEKQQRMLDVVWQFSLELVRAAASRPASKFLVASPLPRPGNAWMARNRLAIERALAMALEHQPALENVKPLAPVAEELLAFDRDGIVLAPATGKNYVRHLLEQSEGWFGEAASGSSRRSASELAEETLPLQVDEVSEGTSGGALEDEVARNSEEADTAANRSAEHSTLVVGLLDRGSLPEDPEEEGRMLRCLALELCRRLKPGFQGEVASAYAVNRDRPGRFAFRFQLDSRSRAREIRELFHQLSSRGNLPGDLAGTVLSPVLTVGTLVRVDILKAIARKLSGWGPKAFVMTWLPQPLLFYPSLGFAHSFVEAARVHGHLLSRSDLGAAYHQASIRFEGLLKLHFLVLEDPVHQSDECEPPLQDRGLKKSRRSLKSRPLKKRHRHVPWSGSERESS